MFFRLKKTKSGQVLKLIESFRDYEGVPRHRTVASMGNAPIEKKDWKVIAKAVEGRLYGQGELINRDLDEEQSEWVDRIVRQISGEDSWRPVKEVEPAGSVIDGVIPGKVTHTETAQLGPEIVGWHTWKRLGMPEILDGLGFNKAQSQAAAIAVINRLVDPVSEHSLLDWYRHTGLPELMNNKLRGAGDDRFYRASDRLLKDKDAIESHLREQQKNIFNLSRTVLLYDLTNTHFEGVCKNNPKAKRGKNKQKRNDCPQIVIGMLFDEFGFEMAHKVFEGSFSDSKSLLEMIDHLNDSAGEEGEKPLVVMDSGIATKENIALLKDHRFGYLVNDSRTGRKRYLKEFREDEFHIVKGREKKAEVMVRVMNDPDPVEGNEETQRIVLCKSLSRGEKERAIISNAESRFIEALKKLALRVEKGSLKDQKKIQRAIGRIQARHTRVAKYYDVQLTGNNRKLAVQWTRDDERMKDQADLFGCYVLRTNEQTLNEEDLWKLYISLSRAENGFRALKTDLGLRPNPHSREDRVDGHVFICILAYHLLRNILWSLEQQGDHRSWETLKRVLRTHCYTTILLPTDKGQIHRIRVAGQPEECQKQIYRNLDVQWLKLPRFESIIKDSVIRSKSPQRCTTL